ncbi:NAD-dependent epimerase/dehydratase family protein [Mesorhizobium qingshengii]|uniref:NAD dependent epimerase/dehydratase family protein n=1 Tax=Mesorhizobium qingshengii TaxID=1165689 RepID=A0A1G5ZDX9_9HYPH|nr:NAD-dependent epimerase/dehydratase family protein [Mesorhizobium qingshengii]SDA92735.1 NAD dependent epimerase/dehydratase family protein [Mesorhizobium qingshengii]
MLQRKPIRGFNHGEMWRDFTYIDDVVDGVVAVLDMELPLFDRTVGY